jgi:hypothetical protein
MSHSEGRQLPPATVAGGRVDWAGACLLAALASLIVPKGPSRSRTAAMAMASD